jgi:hypothetical protein
MTAAKRNLDKLQTLFFVLESIKKLGAFVQITLIMFLSEYFY